MTISTCFESGTIASKSCRWSVLKVMAEGIIQKCNNVNCHKRFCFLKYADTSLWKLKVLSNFVVRSKAQKTCTFRTSEIVSKVRYYNFLQKKKQVWKCLFCLTLFSPHLSISTQVLFCIWHKSVVLFTSTCNIIYFSIFKIWEIQNMSLR